jgi:hypothetical protein
MKKNKFFILKTLFDICPMKNIFNIVFILSLLLVSCKKENIKKFETYWSAECSTMLVDDNKFIYNNNTYYFSDSDTLQSDNNTYLILVFFDEEKAEIIYNSDTCVMFNLSNILTHNSF